VRSRCGLRFFGRGASLLVIAAGLTAGAARARAETVAVEIRADRPGVSIGLTDWEAPGAVVACGEHCALNLAPGAYRLDLTGADGHVASRKLVVRRPSHVTVAPPDASARETGAILKDTGTGFAALGLGMLMYSLFHQVSISYTCSDCDRQAWVAYAGASLLVGGGALGFAGRAIEQRNSQPHLEITHPPGAATAGLRLSPVASPRWAGLALTGSF
jgi:hypothetical protein